VSEQAESSQDDNTGNSAAPFLGALAVIVAVVIAVWLFNVFSGDRITDDQLVTRAVVGQNDALQRQHYDDFRSYTCAGQRGDESKTLSAQRDSVTKHGQRFVDGVSGVSVDGDRATAEVTYHFDKNPDAKQTVRVPLAREDGGWKVCATGPS
jgi:hypothetical protein